MGEDNTENDTSTSVVLGGGGSIASATNIKTDSQKRVLVSYTKESPDGKAKLIIPEGTTALDADGKSLKSISISSTQIGGTIMACNLGPSGATFDPKVTLIFEFDSGDVSGGETVVVKFFDGSEWIPLETTVDITKNTATAKVSHFSVFALFIEEKSISEAQIQDFTPTSQAPTPSPSVTVAVQTVIPWIWIFATIAVIVVTLGFLLYIRNSQK